jgi:hypothetical protein
MTTMTSFVPKTLPLSLSDRSVGVRRRSCEGRKRQCGAGRVDYDPEV